MAYSTSVVRVGNKILGSIAGATGPEGEIIDLKVAVGAADFQTVGGMIVVHAKSSGGVPLLFQKWGEYLFALVEDPAADLNADGVVDGDDAGLVLAAWGPGAGEADLDGSGTVDGGDAGHVLAAWGQTSKNIAENQSPGFSSTGEGSATVQLIPPFGVLQTPTGGRLYVRVQAAIGGKHVWYASFSVTLIQ